MATNMSLYVNYVNGAVARATTPADFILVDLAADFLIWSATLANLLTHQPTASELNAAASIIDPAVSVTVARCLLMDYSHNVGGSYYTHLINGMGLNKQFVFCYAFDAATATEPQLEAWDTTSHATFNLNVLGAGFALNSFVKAVCTTTVAPETNWSGTPIAGGSNVVLLNDGNGALLGAGDLYSNIKIVIPANYTTPAAENFIFTVRYTFSS